MNSAFSVTTALFWSAVEAEREAGPRASLEKVNGIAETKVRDYLEIKTPGELDRAVREAMEK